MSQFTVHQNQLAAAEETYLTGDNAVIAAGFQPNQPAYAAAVNAILHETSLVVTALMNKVSETTGTAYTPDMTSSDVSTLADAIENCITMTTVDDATNAVNAEHVNHALTFKINTAPADTFNGSADKTIGPIYAATSVGSEGQLLLANSSGIPEWNNSSFNTTDTTPLYLDAFGRPAKCKQYAGATRLNVNGNTYTSSATIYAPSDAPTALNQVVISDSGGGPAWSQNDFQSSQTKPIFFDRGGSIDVCLKYAGGTKVTFNGADKGADDITIYAPSSAGSDNYVAYWDDNLTTKPVWYESPFYLKGKYNDGFVYREKYLTQRIAYTDSSTVVTVNDNGSFAEHTSYTQIYDATRGFETDVANTTATFTECISDNVFSGSYWTLGYAWSKALTKNNVQEAAKPMMKLTCINRTTSDTGEGQLWVDSGGILTTGNIIAAGAISTAAGVSAQSFTATSDIRLKENVKDYEPKRSILDLQTKEFDFKSDGSHHIGCIAQDLQEIAPEIVHEDEHGYLAIEETKIVYLLLDEVKKLRKELNELKGNKQ